LGRLIQNFLAFSRMERKKYVFHFSLRPARQVIDAAVASMHGRLEAPGCRFDLQIDDNLPLVKVDPDALATALINLLENACKYSDENKHIVVQARVENGRVLFSVKDNGIGIAPRERKKIFQPFYQADPHLSRKGSGCGLGLSIVQFITTAHHGRVVVESCPGGGSTFTLCLPVAARAKTTPEEVVS
jgi:two-component system, OmpR family, phosphate regulon sensor histidine kinase PhoR